MTIAVPTYGSTNANGSINRFDPNTGKSTAPASGGNLGTTSSDSAGQLFYSKASADASTKTIASTDINNPTPQIPTYPTTPTSANGVMTGNNAGLASGLDQL